MEQHDFLQGSSEWHAHRAAHFNASDAPVMLGISKYKTRSTLLKQYATGIFDEVIDEATQSRFDDGHRFEALARPLAEKIIGQRLFPVVGSEGKLSASFDGLTMDDSICFEHKSLNNDLRESLIAGVIPAMYCAQMEQQLMLAGAEKCLFMASKFDSTDNLIEEQHGWYFSNSEMRERLIQGWTQFAIDIENYSEVEYIPAPAKAKPTMDLPAVSLNVTGGLRVITNLDLFHEALKHFISNINMEPSNDQDFADCKEAVKKLKAAEDSLDAGEAQALAQITSIDEMRRMKKLVFETSRNTRLAVEKMVKERDVLVKRQIVQDAAIAFSNLIDTLNQQIGKPYMPTITANFAEVMKSKKTFASMREAVSNELVRVTIEANAISSKICINMNSLRDFAKDYIFLFSDTPSIVLKENDDLMALITVRINQHKIDEAEKEEATRVRIRAEEEARAQAEIETRLRAERETEARRIADEQAHADAVFQEAQDQLAKPAATPPLSAVSKADPTPIAEVIAPVKAQPTSVGRNPRPTRMQMIEVIATHYNITVLTADEWLRNEFAEIAA